MRINGIDVAEYVTEPDVRPEDGPRPYLHPVRTLGGVVTTDVLPADHTWHLGVSVALQDVGGTNFWGGRTYVRGQGYTWRDDHGRIVQTGPGRLEWRDKNGKIVLYERRALAAELADRGWALRFDYTLTAPEEVTLGSPATNGRPGGAGYGGFFWRAAPGPAHTFTAGRDGEDEVNGSDEPWVALHGPGPYTLVFDGLSGADRWFVRTGIYPGVCAAPAFTDPLTLEAGASLTRRLRVLVADGHLTREEIRSCPPYGSARAADGPSR